MAKEHWTRRMKRENAALKQENAQLKTENAQLKSEVNAPVAEDSVSLAPPDEELYQSHPLLYTELLFESGESDEEQYKASKQRHVNTLRKRADTLGLTIAAYIALMKDDADIDTESNMIGNFEHDTKLLEKRRRLYPDIPAEELTLSNSRDEAIYQAWRNEVIDRGLRYGSTNIEGYKQSKFSHVKNIKKNASILGVSLRKYLKDNGKDTTHI